jgi:DNA-binding response OmpR family regulator
MGNILIADDDKNCRDSIQKVLEKEGHDVRTAKDVDAALAALGLDHYDLVVCDYRMPGKTGMDLLAEMRRNGSSVPVLVISAFADGTAEASFLELGAMGFLRKPIRRQELIEQTAKVVGG